VQKTFSLLAILLMAQTGIAAAQEIERPVRPRLAPRIIPNSAAPAVADPSPARPENFIPQNVPVNHRPVAEMKKLFASLVTPGGAVLDQPGEKSLLIVDSPQNLQRMLEIKNLIDDPAFAGTRIDIFQPKTASAEELAADMTELARAYFSPAAFSIGFIPLPGINQILVVTPSEEAWSNAHRWLERIDQTAGTQRRIFVYPTEPEKMNELAAKSNRLADEGKDAGQRDPAIQARPRIQADPPTHSLIIYGTAQEFLEIKNALNPGGQMNAFKQRLSAFRQRIESDRKKTGPSGVKSPS
jgi:type II secretory pathway component GspD/PulD (secretin)